MSFYILYRAKVGISQTLGSLWNVNMRKPLCVCSRSLCSSSPQLLSQAEGAVARRERLRISQPLERLSKQDKDFIATVCNTAISAPQQASVASKQHRLLLLLSCRGPEMVRLSIPVKRHASPLRKLADFWTPSQT